jgi:hypothetical protein
MAETVDDQSPFGPAETSNPDDAAVRRNERIAARLTRRSIESAWKKFLSITFWARNGNFLFASYVVVVAMAVSFGLLKLLLPLDLRELLLLGPAELAAPQRMKAAAALLVYLVTLTFGALIALRSLLRLDGDLSTVRFADRKIDELRGNRGSYETGRIQNLLISGRWSDVPIDHMPTAVRLIQSTCLAAGQFRFEPVGVILANYYPEITSGSRGVRGAQVFGIRLGITLTFIGLMLSLQPLVGVFAGKVTADIGTSLDLAISEIVGQLSFAFGSSVAGLAAALVLQIVLWISRRRENQLLRTLEDLIGGIHDLYLNAIQKTPLLAGMQALGDAMRHHGKELYSQTRVIEGASQGLISVVEGQHKALAERIDAVSGNRDQLAALAREQSAEIGRLRDLYAQLVSLEERMIATMQQGMGAATSLQREAFQDLQAALRDSFETTQSSIKSIPVEDKVAMLSAIKEGLDRAAASFVAAGQAQGDVLARALAGILKELRSLQVGNTSDERVVQMLGASFRRLEAMERQRRRLSIATLLLIVGTLLGIGTYYWPELAHRLSVFSFKEWARASY